MNSGSLKIKEWVITESQKVDHNLTKDQEDTKALSQITVDKTVTESALGMNWELQKNIIMYDIQNQHKVLQQQHKINFKETNHSYCKWNL